MLNLNPVWLVDPETNYLTSPYERQPKLQAIPSAKPFTVSLLSCVINEDFDGFLRGDNDILIVTQSSLGEKPPVDRVLFYEQEIAAGQPIVNVLSENILVTDDYSGIDRLWLELRVMEIDTDERQYQILKNSLISLNQTLGAAFPVLLPYTYIGQGLIGIFDKFMNILERDTKVIKVPFSFYPEKTPRPGRAPLQTGTYVMFSQPERGQRFKMEASGLLVEHPTLQPAKVSYITFDVTMDKIVTPEFVIGDKMATLLTQIRSGNRTTAPSSLDFLTETITHYAKFKALLRYSELSKKIKKTPEEQERMNKIKEDYPDLVDYLPK